MRKIVVLFLAVLVSSLIAAQQPGAVQRSEIIEKIDGKEYYIHLVRQGQTLQEIANVYQVSVAEINQENPRLKGVVSTGDVMKIPKSSSTVRPAETLTQPAVSTPAPATQTTQSPGSTSPSRGVATHTVNARETFFGIARQYNITVPELRSANPGIEELQPGQILNIPVPQPVSPVQTTPPTRQTEQEKPVRIPETYTVQAGETLFSISRLFGISVDELNLLNPELTTGLKAGQTIRLKKQEQKVETQYKSVQDTSISYTYHRVRRGETLFGIGKKYGISAGEIIHHNPHVTDGLQPRQTLQIPVYTITQRKVAIEAVVPEPAEIPKEILPAIPEDCHPLADRSKVYNIALMVPFFLDSKEELMQVDTLRPGAQSGANRPYEFMQFYYGAMMAIDSLGSAGLKAKVFVYDVDNSAGSVSKVLAKPELKEMDMIIGPLYANSFDRVARFARDQKIKIVNPLSTRDDFLLNNPYTIKAQSSTKDQVHVIASYIKSNFANHNIIVVRQFSFSETETLAIFKREFGDLGLNEVIYIRDSLDGVRRRLDRNRENIIVGLSTDKVFIMDLIRKLNDIRANYPVTCFGMQEWEDFGLDTDHIVNLNLHLPSSSFVDYDSEPVKHFFRSFREKYGVEPLPNRFAFSAFDITYYFVNAMMKYGAAFNDCLPSYHHRGLQIPFSFEPKGRNGFENKGLTIYKIENFKQVEVYPK